MPAPNWVASLISFAVAAASVQYVNTAPWEASDTEPVMSAVPGAQTAAGFVTVNVGNGLLVNFTSSGPDSH